MTIAHWWGRRSGSAKTVTVLAVLLILQIGLCFSTPYTVQPIHDAMFGRDTGELAGLGLWMVQAFLCVCTLVFLIIAIIVSAVSGRSAAKSSPKGDSND
jgi:uncharacterized membrane protein